MSSWFSTISQSVGALVETAATMANEAQMEFKQEEEKAKRGAGPDPLHPAAPPSTLVHARPSARPPAAAAAAANTESDPANQSLNLPWEDLGANCPEGLKNRVKAQVPAGQPRGPASTPRTPTRPRADVGCPLCVARWTPSAPTTARSWTRRPRT